MTYLKIVCAEFKNQSRDERELSVAQELKMDILVVAKGDRKKDRRMETTRSNYKLCFYTTRYLGESRFLIPLNRIFTIFLWSMRIRKLNPEIISGHDLTAYLIGYFSTRFVSNPPKLIYDAHEFEIGRNIKRNLLQKKIIGVLEKFAIRTSDLSIVVSDSIAAKVQEKYNLNMRPLVIRNIPYSYHTNEQKSAELRKTFLKQMGLEKDTFLLMYHGGVIPNRGIEAMLNIVGSVSNTAGIVLGNGDENYLKSLKKLCKQIGIDSKVLFLEAVSQQQLGDYVGAVDLEVILIPGICESYYYMLPNKFFESIQSMTPILASNFPEVKKIIDLYDIGITCDPYDMENVCKSVSKLKDNPQMYFRLKENLIKAKKELCWEKENLKLKKSLNNIMKEKKND